MLAAGIAEWRRSTGGKIVDREGTRSRLATGRCIRRVAEEVDRLADRLNILATVGSVAPFVGLFGTVWGIMRSFTDIAGANNTSLAVVAPGIAEALFATALGLFAAIPAVIAYNRMSFGINRLEARLQRFADGFHAHPEPRAGARRVRLPSFILPREAGGGGPRRRLVEGYPAQASPRYPSTTLRCPPPHRRWGG